MRVLYEIANGVAALAWPVLIITLFFAIGG